MKWIVRGQRSWHLNRKRNYLPAIYAIYDCHMILSKSGPGGSSCSAWNDPVHDFLELHHMKARSNGTLSAWASSSSTKSPAPVDSECKNTSWDKVTGHVAS